MNDDRRKAARRSAQDLFDKDRASRWLGMQIEIPEAGRAVVTMTVTANMVNGFDICHGGLVFSLADSAFAFACNADGRRTVAAGASIEWLKPARLGDRLTADAREIQRSSRGGYYDVQVSNQAGELVALFRGRGVETEKAAGGRPQK